ncbi:DUF2000 domain-containing protein [Nocardioides endophyticus]
MSGTYKTTPYADRHRGPMAFDTKIAVLLRDDLETWQELNATAFLVSGVTAAYPQLVGEAYGDADGTPYLAMLGQPVMVFQGDAAMLRTAHERAVRRGETIGVFTSDLFRTGNDEDNRAAVAAVRRDDLDLVGIAVHAPRNAVDKILKGAVLHP